MTTDEAYQATLEAVEQIRREKVTLLVRQSRGRTDPELIAK
jgi:hypothetical protein